MPPDNIASSVCATYSWRASQEDYWLDVRETCQEQNERVIRFAERWAGEGFVGVLEGRVAVVQYTITTRVDGDVLEVCWSYCSEVGFVKVPVTTNAASGYAVSCSLMALFHCMVGTVRYGTVHFWGVFHWVLYLVPDTFLVPLRSRFQASRTVTKTWRVNSVDHWLAGENRHYCVTELATRDPPLQPYPLDLNQHSQRRIGRNFCLNKRTFLHQPQNSSVVVCWGSTDVLLVHSRGADPVRAWWHDAEWKSLMFITLLLNLLYFQSMFSVYIFTSVSVFCFN